MRRLTKTILATAAAATLVTGMAAPAAARGHGGRHYGGHHHGSGFGNFLAGALVVGTVAAIASSASRKDRGYDRSYPPPPPRGYGYNEGYVDDDNGLNACAATAEREAQRYTRDNARVVEIRAVDNSGRNTRFTGRIEVADDGYSSDRRDSARFTCTAEYGRVTGFIFDDGFGYAAR